MATSRQIAQVMTTLRQLQPAPCFKLLNEAQMGAGAVIRYLREAEGEVSAGNIADFMGVSTARVAVLLRKMAAKGLIVKETSPTDGRVTIVRLSEAGEKTAEAMKENICHRVGQIIDRLGMERMEDFLESVREIATLMQEAPPELDDLL